jgi:hypothetical protein
MFYIADSAGQPQAPKLEHIYVSLGSLTDPIDAKPVAHVSYEERVSWIGASEALPKYRAKTDERVF